MEENGLNVRKLQRTEENSNELKKLATNWRNWQSYGRHVAIDRRRKRGIKLKRNCLPSDCSNAVYPWSLRETWTSPSELTRDRRVSLFWLIATFKRKTFLKMGLPPASFSFIFVSNKQYNNSYNKYMWQNVHQVYWDEMQTHDLQKTSLLP